MAERFELAAQFRVVINLAVEHQHRIAIVAPHRLRAVLEVDDFQTHCAQ